MAFVAVVGFIGIAGMIGSVCSSGYDAGRSMKTVQNNIDNNNNITKSMQEKWNSLISGQVKLDEQIKQEILDYIDQIGQISDKMKVAKKDFQNQFRKIQMSGVIIITIVFFLLLFKMYM